MTETLKFDELTYWHRLQPVGVAMGWDPGWRATPGAFAGNIGRSDPYWDMVLNKARTAYGDPNIHFNTADNGADRYLVFGDGTPVPRNGSLAYRDSANDTTYLLNDDGSVTPWSPDGQAGQPIFPSAFRRGDGDQYAPIDSTGNQIAPLKSQPPQTPYGYHDHNGVLTPKNSRGDYYVQDPAIGERTYFDAAGKPITEQQFREGTNAAVEDEAQALPTEQQQSGATADAVRKLHEELKNRYSEIGDAEGKLSEALLNARATTVEGQQKLSDIQERIVEAINNPALSLDTPAGEQAFLQFLRSQVAAIGEVLASGSLTAEDQAKTVAALGALYAVDPGQEIPEPAAPDQPSTAGSSPPAAPAVAGPVDAGLGPAEPMPDPTLSDLGLGPMGGPSDALSPLASALPAALGAFPGAGFGAGIDPLAGLAGAAAPLAGLATQLGEQARRTDAEEVTPDRDAKEEDEPEEAESEGDDEDAGSPPQADSAPLPAPEAAPPPEPAAGPPPPAVAPTTIALPDGSTANARTPELAAAVKAHLAGAPVPEAYRQAGIELPPPGTPVLNPVDPSKLSAGNLGMFRDHYVVALSSAKALQDGDVVSLSAVGSGPDFLGWVDPTAVGVGSPAPPPAAPAPLATPTG